MPPKARKLTDFGLKSLPEPSRGQKLSDEQADRVLEEALAQATTAKRSKKPRFQPQTDRDGRPVPKEAKNDKPMKSFWKSLPLPEFKRALATSPDNRMQMLFTALSAPQLANCSFGELCRRCGLTLKDVASLWRDYNFQLGFIKMAQHLPQVMEDVAVDALSKQWTCPACNGEGRIEQPEGANGQGKGGVRDICRMCRGDGVIREIGDKHARDLVFESVGLKGQKGPLIAQQINVNELPTLEDTLDEKNNEIHTIPVTPEPAQP